MSNQPKPTSERSAIEVALRHLGTSKRWMPVDLLRYAIDLPGSETGKKLTPLTEPSAVVDDWTSDERADALWRIIQEGVRDPSVGPTQLSRRRRALHAALRLPDPDIHEPWGSSLTARFKQLRTLTAVFDDPTTNQPMDMAWKRGVKNLTEYLARRFNNLRTTADWEPYRSAVRHAEGAGPAGLQSYFEMLDESGSELDPPSKGAQPVFVDLFITTVFMRRQSVYRRITERIVTAKEDEVEYYKARGFSVGRTSKRTYVPVNALWGCEAQEKPANRSGGPIITELWFPSPLQKGQKAHFASEAIFDPSDTEDDERDWINVDIDHHGIAKGYLFYDDRLPVRGLTIRIRFDESCLPEAVWWYAELTEEERYTIPPDDDTRRLTIIGNGIQKTFTERPCRPRQNYGIAFSWPD